MTLSDYSQLKQQIIISVGTSERHIYLLEQLKHIFEGQINSPRRFEQITTIGQLLKILELRDVLSADQVSPLRYIADKLQNSNEILKKISEYESSHMARKYVNYYANKQDQNLQSANNKGLPKNDTKTNLFSATMSSKKIERINKTVIEEIGSNWKDLSRHLKIRECQIDSIDKNNITLYNKASEAIKIFNENKDDQSWFFTLCDALEKSRRRDIAKSLQHIITMNI